MPTLQGEALTDASNQALTDAVPAALAEAGIVVQVLAGGILAVAGGPSWDDLVGLIVDGLTDAVDFGSILGLGPQIELIQNGIGLQLDNWEKFAYNSTPAGVTYDGDGHTYGGQSIRAILDAIAGIETGTGGLTEEEHDQLMQLLNVDYDDIASAVWGFTLPVNWLDGTYWGPMAQTALRCLLEKAQLDAGFKGYTLLTNPYFTYLYREIENGNSAMGYWGQTPVGLSLPILDLSLVQEGDTVLAYLEREYPAFDWTTNPPLGDPPISGGVVYLEIQEGYNYYRCNLTDADIRTVANTNNITIEIPPIPSPPVWTGSSSITLGTPVTLANNLVVAGPMDGVLIDITVPPTKTGLRLIGSEYYDYGVGEMAFENDSGYLEMWQYLGFRQMILTPKSFTRADAAHFRVLAGAEGTVTPWTKD